jgi:fatty-acyl-CoA synthase
VFGIPDEHWGEAVHAAVEAKPNAVIDVQDIIAFLKQELGSVKAPKVVHVYQSMPKSAVGKVLKKNVRDDVIAALPNSSANGKVFR